MILYYVPVLAVETARSTEPVPWLGIQSLFVAATAILCYDLGSESAIGFPETKKPG